MNKDVGSGGMGTKVKSKSFDIITMSSDSSANKNGAYYDPYHTAIRQNESEEYEVWLVDSGSNINNYSSTGTVDESFGIEPGSSGVIKFYVRPYEDVNVQFTFQTIGYTAQTRIVGGQSTTVMTELSSAAGRPACFLNGHVLLFLDHSGGYYTGIIPTGGDGKRTFSQEFLFGGSYDSDTDGDGQNDAYEVEINWIWPVTLDTLVKNPNSPTQTLCDKDAVVGQEQINDYDKVVNNICTYPQYYLSGYSPTATYTEENLRGRNAQYNDADQEIGMNIDYVLLRLEAEPVSGD